MIAVACVILAALLAIVIYMLARAVNELMFLREELQEASDIEHTKCMGAVMQFVGDEFAAQVLAVAADDYQSAENQSDLARISRLIYEPGGPPVPTIWLHERADKLRIMADSPVLPEAVAL